MTAPQMAPYTPALYEPNGRGRFRQYPRVVRTPIPGAGYRVGKMLWKEQELNLRGSAVPVHHGSYAQVPLRGLAGTTREIGTGIRRRTPRFVSLRPRYERLHGLGMSAKARRYWNQRAKACRGFADEGECLAQVARHVPVTIGGIGMGSTASDIAAALRTSADIIRDPEGTMRVQGPKIVSAVDKHVLTPMMGKFAKAMGPYLVKYVLPPLAILYLLTGLSAYYSYKGYKSRVRPNRRRRRRRR